nr:unnamed protein product [Callosobruchus chinensis]
MTVDELHRQTWSNPPRLAVCGCAVDHAIDLSTVDLQSVTLVQMLSYYSQRRSDEDRFSKIAAAKSLSIDVNTQAFSSLDQLFIRAMFSNCK